VEGLGFALESTLSLPQTEPDIRGSSPSGYPAEPLVQLPDQSTTLWVDFPSTSDSRLRAHGQVRTYAPHQPIWLEPVVEGLTLTVPLFERRHVAGAAPNAFLKARENAASES
jgi:hypothetical protein